MLFTKTNFLLLNTCGWFLLLIVSSQFHFFKKVLSSYCTGSLVPWPHRGIVISWKRTLSLLLRPEFPVLSPQPSTSLCFQHIYSLKLLVSFPYPIPSVYQLLPDFSLLCYLWITRSVISVFLGMPSVFSSPCFLPLLSHPTSWSNSSIVSSGCF